ncbi:MAG: electron transfer flavoprotein subunit beta/FixA family protein [Flammeovirgaceae bacterium]|nr:electron transfer flavoprotein subunit beta/FixA family protein [Flammeovirgaceae bacterium]
MNIIVPIKQVPDLVEGLEIDESGKDLNREWIKLKLNEFDDHALEEALLLKEESGATVTAIAIDSQDIDKVLFTAAAKGADKIIKVTGNFGTTVTSHEAAKALANAISSMQYDLVLTGVQAVDDRDGQIAVLLANYLNVPHVSVVTGVSINGGAVSVMKEYGGGNVAEFECTPPLVLGIQAARQTPRYVPVAKVRQIMKSATLEEVAGGDVSVVAASTVQKFSFPTGGGSAQMIEGSAEEQANKIFELLKEKGIK